MASDDWGDDWIFDDPRFGLTDSDEKLLAFIAEMRTSVVAVSPLRAITRQAASASSRR